MSEPSAAPTLSFRGRGRGRGRSQAVRAHVARLAQARKAANGRRGRQKLYDHPKPQAASERLKELKAAFSTVANALRPALEDLADRSLDQLKASSGAYRAFNEYRDVKAFLDGRLRQVQDINANQLLLDTRLKDYTYETSRTLTEQGFTVRAASSRLQAGVALFWPPSGLSYSHISRSVTWRMHRTASMTPSSSALTSWSSSMTMSFLSM